MAESDHSWLTAALAEYQSLRDESVSAISNQIKIFAVGTGFVGLLLGFAFDQFGTDTSALVLTIAIPLICVLTVLVWTGEIVRMVRAGAYIALLEKRINDFVGDKPSPMGWELWLNEAGKTKKRNTTSYQALVVMLVLIALFSGLGGLWTMRWELSYSWLTVGLVFLGLAVVGLSTVAWVALEQNRMRAYKIT